MSSSPGFSLAGLSFFGFFACFFGVFLLCDGKSFWGLAWCLPYLSPPGSRYVVDPVHPHLPARLLVRQLRLNAWGADVAVLQVVPCVLFCLLASC